VYHAVVTVHWSVTWMGGGKGGRFPDLVRTAGFPVKVVEVHSALNGTGR
jgi:hypothetical protein